MPLIGKAVKFFSWFRFVVASFIIILYKKGFEEYGRVKPGSIPAKTKMFCPHKQYCMVGW
jgi:hypothetical protein